MEEALARWGPLAILLGAAVEGDLTLLLAGVVAHLGLVRLPYAIAAGCLGGVAGDSAYYALGRSCAAAVQATRAWERAAPTIDRLARRLGPREIVLARFVWGTRIASMVFWGIHRLPLGRFLLFDLLAAGMHAALLVGLGFGLSGSAAALLGEVRRVEVWLLGAVGVAAAVVLVLRAVVRRRMAAVA